MEELKGNSTAEKRKPEIRKVISDDVIVTKPSKLKRFSEVFLAEDIRSVTGYVIHDVIVPTLKKAVVDIVTDGINTLFYGETAHRNRTSSNRISYVSFGNGDWNRASRSAFYKDDIQRTSSAFKFKTRIDAEEVLANMEAVVEQYGSVSVADLYQMMGITPKYTDYNYGWKNLSDANVVKVREGWMLNLPREIDIKN